VGWARTLFAAIEIFFVLQKGLKRFKLTRLVGSRQTRRFDSRLTFLHVFLIEVAMKLHSCLTISLFNLLALVAVPAFAQAPATPGPEHAALKAMEGEWSAVIKMMGEEMKGSSKSKMGLGGLWLLTEFKGEGEGAAFEGRGIDGYDQDKKKYVSIWVDSMTSSAMTFEGTYDEKTKTMTSFAEGKGPDGKPAKFKGVTTMPDKDHQVFKMFVVADGKDNLMMTIEYERKK
jgi:hypothetical protein